ncbi:MAG: EAL domain-containing protein [Sulfuricella sp.]|nr:EAL domain-containing protein [Sulfuricella sp.]
MKKILVIEDEAPLRNNLAMMLRVEGYQVLSAENGQVGLDVARAEQPDLILSDVMMPVLDGHGVLRALREKPETASIPFVFLTALADRSDFRTGMNLGADDYLVKPFSRNEVLETVQARLHRQESLTQVYQEQVREAEEKAQYYLYHDPVTGLPNLMSLRENFAEVLENALGMGVGVAVVAIRPDRLDAILANLPAEEAAGLFRSLAERLGQASGEGMLTRPRYDQLLALIPSATPDATAARVLESAAQPLHVGSREIYLSCSIGVACYPEDGTDIDTLARHASLAADESILLGGNCWRRFCADKHLPRTGRIELETALLRALERDEFVLYYQPQVSLKEGRVVGMEALIRWQSPERGFVSPGEFIPAAEESGLIAPLGEWVLRSACRQAQAWRAQGYTDLRMGVNLSGRQFTHSDITALLADALAESGLPPEWLELEVTESVLMRDLDQGNAILTRLREMGVKVSLDDFGTGYSSLSYLKKLPLDTLKIDQSFVRNVHTSKQATAMVSAIARMGRDLNLHLIAEGVESPEELAILRQEDCDEIQGFYFSKPLPAPAFLELLRSGKRLG